MIVKPGEQVVIGLGNPQPQFDETPHNVGYAVLDQLARSMGLEWTAMPEAWIARGSYNGQGVYLVKLRMAMNVSGIMLKRLSDAMGFGPKQCILIHDDLHMPIGAVRMRMSGGAGGHRGVASILGAFQSDEFRRVKLGVASENEIVDRAVYVLTPFDAGSKRAIDPAIVTAASRVDEMLRHFAS